MKIGRRYKYESKILSRLKLEILSFALYALPLSDFSGLYPDLGVTKVGKPNLRFLKGHFRVDKSFAITQNENLLCYSLI